MKKRIVIFTLLSFGLTWGTGILLSAGGMIYGDGVSAIYLSACMLTPALSNVLTRLITKEGFKDCMLGFNIKGNVKTYLAGAYLPAVLIFFGSAVFFLLFPSMFSAAITQTNNFALFILLTPVISPFVNIIFTFGEEFGWRAYLLPKLCEKYSPVKSALITGFVWGLWHAPMIAMGHNYGTLYKTYPYGGIIMMTAFCVFTGAFLSYITMKTKSVWPAAMAHSAINALAGTGAYFCLLGYDPFAGPLPTGMIGGSGFIIAGIISFFLLRKSYRA